MTLAPAHIESFRDAVAQRLGLRIDDSKLDELADVLRLRLRETNSLDVENYLCQFRVSMEEVRAVVCHITVPETYFFRLADHFWALRELVLAHRIRARGESKRLNILSAGCASGEEPYSIAMVVRENVELTGWEVSIRGIDVNPAMIAKGRAARYSEWSLREIDPEIKRRYFRQQRREFHLQDRIREMVSLEEGNLADEHAVFWQSSTYDIIFFRNVLMYFSPEAGRAVVARMAESLVPGGYLFLGPAETLRAVSQDFHLCHTRGAFYYQRRNGVPNNRPESTANAVSQTAPAAVGESAEPGTDWMAAISQASDRVEKLARTAKYVQDTPPRAESHKDAATKHAPADVSTVLQLLQRERFEEALDALPEITDKSRANADVQLLRAVLLVNSGALSEAEIACMALLKEDDLNAGAHYIMALCKESAGNQHSATEHDQIAIYLDPSFAMPHLHLGLLSKRAGNLSTARQELHQASLLLGREDSSRVLLFGGGFSRDALASLCRSELQGCGGPA